MRGARGAQTYSLVFFGAHGHNVEQMRLVHDFALEQEQHARLGDHEHVQHDLLATHSHVHREQRAGT
jgi:hypothetical protein